MATNFKDKKIAILGLGIEGVSTAKFLKEKGAVITILDKKSEDQIEPSLFSEANDLGASFVLGEEYLAHLTEYDIVVRSPGISSSLPEIQAAKEKGVEITSQTKLFFDLCPCRIVGVTGSKGKGTTSTLIYEMLKASGLDAHLGGNMGTPPLLFLEKLTKASVVVLELSSYQLEDVTKSPHIAVLLMIVPDHLDYHGGMSEYVEAKRNILRFQTKEDFAIVNRDYLPTHESDLYTDGQVYYVTRERSNVEQGTFIKDNAIWIQMKGTEWKIIDTDKIALLGKHNWENAAAAAMAATLAGATKSDIFEVLNTFKGLEHRLEFVQEVQGVRYYDDSIATNPESTIAAIQSFEDPKILILGGVTEGSDFTELGKVISEDLQVKAIIGIGKEWPTLKQEIAKGEELRAKSGEPIILLEGAKDMQTVVAAASKIAVEGDVVLLSPACKSFDMFKSYKDRGEQFKKAVNDLL